MRYFSMKELNAMAYTTTALAILFTLGRFVIHYRKNKRLGLDDAFNGIAAIFLLGFLITWQRYTPAAYQAELYQLGLDKTNPAQLPPRLFQQYNLANGILFWCSIYSAKASLLALYWKVFEISRAFRLMWIGSMAYMILSFIATIMIRVTVCGRLQDVLNQKKCRTIGKAGVMRMQVPWCILDGVGDIILVILPIMMLRRMYLKLYLKLQLGFLFGIVAINLATNVLRTVFTINRDLKQFSHLNASWVFFQITTAVIICSLPCYGSLLTYKKKNPTQLVGTPASGSKFSKGSGSLKTADSQDSIYKHTKVETTAIC